MRKDKYEIIGHNLNDNHKVISIDELKSIHDDVRILRQQAIDYYNKDIQVKKEIVKKLERLQRQDDELLKEIHEDGDRFQELISEESDWDEPDWFESIPDKDDIIFEIK